jgi:hypothetical protein
MWPLSWRIVLSTQTMVLSRTFPKSSPFGAAATAKDTQQDFDAWACFWKMCLPPCRLKGTRGTHICQRQGRRIFWWRQSSSTLLGPGVLTSLSMQHAQPSVLRGVLGDWSLRQKQLPNWATEVSRPHTSPSRQLSLLALRAPFSAVLRFPGLSSKPRLCIVPSNISTKYLILTPSVGREIAFKFNKKISTVIFAFLRYWENQKSGVEGWKKCYVEGKSGGGSDGKKVLVGGKKALCRGKKRHLIEVKHILKSRLWPFGWAEGPFSQAGVSTGLLSVSLAAWNTLVYS